MDIDPVLKIEMGLDGFDPSEGARQEADERDWQKFREFMRGVEPTTSQEIEKRFAKAYSPDSQNQWTDPWNAPGGRSVVGTLAKMKLDAVDVELKEMLGAVDISQIRSEDARVPVPEPDGILLAKAARAAPAITRLVENFAKGNAAEYVTTGTISDQIQKLRTMLRHILTLDEENGISKALRALDFSCAMQILNFCLARCA